MDLVRFNPMREMNDLRCRVNRMFSDLFTPTVFENQDLQRQSWNPAVDITDNDDSIVIKAELPGVEKKDIHIDVKDRYLTLRGERSTDEEVKEEQVVRRERFYGRFQRVFTLPEAVDVDKIKARHADGLLKIEIPKPATAKPRQITVH